MRQKKKKEEREKDRFGWRKTAKQSRSGINRDLDGRQGFPGAQTVKNLPAMQKTWVQSLGQEDPLEKWMATHPSILASRIHRLMSLVGYMLIKGSKRVRYNWVTTTFTWMEERTSLLSSSIHPWSSVVCWLLPTPWPASEGESTELILSRREVITSLMNQI